MRAVGGHDGREIAGYGVSHHLQAPLAGSIAYKPVIVGAIVLVTFGYR